MYNDEKTALRRFSASWRYATVDVQLEAAYAVLRRNRRSADGTVPRGTRRPQLPSIAAFMTISPPQGGRLSAGSVCRRCSAPVADESIDQQVSTEGALCNAALIRGAASRARSCDAEAAPVGRRTRIATPAGAAPLRHRGSSPRAPLPRSFTPPISWSITALATFQIINHCIIHVQRSCRLSLILAKDAPPHTCVVVILLGR